MKLISFEKNSRQHIGVLRTGHDDQFIDCSDVTASPGNIVELLACPELLLQVKKLLSLAEDSGTHNWIATKSVRLLPVVPRPGKVICVGLNYADHAKEGGNARPDYPAFFFRGSTSLAAHDQPLILSRVSEKFDFEAELAVVIGKTVKYATAENALDAVAGYACFNDGTFRDFQRRSTQWTIGKNFDTTGSLGPCLVSPDELPEGAVGLDISSRLNGKIMQHSNTRDMLWSVAELIVILSECLTLEPGDIIATGTPAGVGYARTPPVFMADGDIIEIVIGGLGTLSNPVKAEQATEVSATQEALV
ncbi:MAG: fumarylacetoacetate hydrolase family protein [Pseudomonadota bacterium]